VCWNCSTALTTANISVATRALDKAEETFEITRSKMIGSATGKPQGIVFIVNGQEVILNAGSKVIVGRGDPLSSTPQPDVDLGPFGAETLGVSRHHVELNWRNGLIYIADVGSTNGTLLNGQRLIAGVERILRDNDELMIGHLRTLVRFVNS
jgi:pSer/pThr/pTyr-binding forkhead associated (FHA) protein